MKNQLQKIRSALEAWRIQGKQTHLSNTFDHQGKCFRVSMIVVGQ